MLKPGGTYGEGDEALEFYAKHTAQIEVSCCDVFFFLILFLCFIIKLFLNDFVVSSLTFFKNF